VSDREKGSSWWQTVPGTLTAIAAVITAVSGLVIALNHAGVIGSYKEAEHEKPAGPETKGPNRGATTSTVDELLENLMVRRIVFFQGDCPPKSVEEPQVEGNLYIYKDQLPRTRWLLELAFPKASREIKFRIDATFIGPDGSLLSGFFPPRGNSRGTSRGNHIPFPMGAWTQLIEPGQTSTWVCGEPPTSMVVDNWQTGRHEVKFRMTSSEAGTFEDARTVELNRVSASVFLR
jgi:hypothetical protein